MNLPVAGNFKVSFSSWQGVRLSLFRSWAFGQCSTIQPKALSMPKNDQKWIKMKLNLYEVERNKAKSEEIRPLRWCYIYIPCSKRGLHIFKLPAQHMQTRKSAKNKNKNTLLLSLSFSGHQASALTLTQALSEINFPGVGRLREMTLWPRCSDDRWFWFVFLLAFNLGLI